MRESSQTQGDWLMLSARISLGTCMLSWMAAYLVGLFGTRFVNVLLPYAVAIGGILLIIYDNARCYRAGRAEDWLFIPRNRPYEIASTLTRPESHGTSMERSRVTYCYLPKAFSHSPRPSGYTWGGGVRKVFLKFKRPTLQILCQTDIHPF